MKICTQGYRSQVYEWLVHWVNDLGEQLPFYGLWSELRKCVTSKQYVVQMCRVPVVSSRVNCLNTNINWHQYDDHPS